MSTPHLRQATSKDVDRCYQIEISAYEGDEAATREKIATRIAQYPEGFLVLELEGVVIGFINSGCAFDVVMSDESFKELVGHDARPDANGARTHQGHTQRPRLQADPGRPHDRARPQYHRE